MNTEIKFLENMTKNKNLTRAKKALIYGCIFLVFSLFTRSCNNSSNCENESILHAESLIWSHPDSSRLILEGIDTIFLSEKDMMYWNLVHEHSLFRLTHRAVADTILQQIAAFFIKNGPAQYAGKALYVRGVSLFASMQYYEAMQTLKEAESFIPQLTMKSENASFVGMIYYIEGAIMETEYLYNVSTDCYRKALHYFEEANDHYRLSACYRNIGRTLSLMDAEIDSIDYYFNKAYEEVFLIKDTLYMYDILIQKEITSTNQDDNRILELCTYLVDSLHNPQYVGQLIKIYSDKHDTAMLGHYLNLLEQDTLLSDWRQRNYHYYHSHYLVQTGHIHQAYSELDALYDHLLRELQNDAKVRTYAIARRYDLEREQEKTLRLTITRQRLWITIAMSAVILMLIIGIASGIIIRQRHREELNRRQKEKAEMERDREAAKRWKAEAEKQEALAREEAKAAEIRILEQNQEIDRINIENLHNSLREQQQQLHTLFANRVQFIAKLKREKEIYHRTMPEWLAEMLDKLTLTNPEEWNRFEHEFKKIFGDILIEIQKQHPNLTKEDLRFLSLYIVGLDNETIGLLLQQELRTLWNRKQKVRNRLLTDNLDEWIEREIIEQVISRRMKENSGGLSRIND